MLICICLAALGGEFTWREARLYRLPAELSAERAKLSHARIDAVAEQDRISQAQIDEEESRHQSLLRDGALLSGRLAREQHEKEWTRRLAHDPQLAKSILETNLLTMEQLGKDSALAAQTALEKVAQLASPSGSRVEVTPDGDGFRVRVAFMMSHVSSQESGAVTKHHSTATMREEIRELSARVLMDLYDYCGSRDIRSISVTCNHTLREPVVPTGATDEERAELVRLTQPVPGRLYRMSLDQSHARSISDWRRVPLSRIIELSAVEYDGLKRLEIRHGLMAEDTRDAEGQLQF
jgi:hypothetical protein